MVKNIFKIIIVFIIGMVGGIFADQIFWPYFVERPLFYQYRLDQQPIYVTERKEIHIQENVALKEAISKVEKVVVGVRTETKTGKIIEGSGLLITSDGLMITLAELIPSGGDFTFYWEDKTPSFQILKKDSTENLALIKLQEVNSPTAGFANLEKIKIGERVFLLGTIFENEIPKKLVNEGILKTFNENYLQTNISEKINLKGSGLFDIEGSLLGLNTIDKDGKIISIPISKIKPFSGL